MDKNLWIFWILSHNFLREKNWRDRRKVENFYGGNCRPESLKGQAEVVSRLGGAKYCIIIFLAEKEFQVGTFDSILLCEHEKDFVLCFV